jgi:ABC-2 type transport system ATP-binding protein
MDHGRILALDTPRGLKASVGADTIVTIAATGDLERLARVLEAQVEGAMKAHRFGAMLQLHVKGASQVLPQVISTAERVGSAVTDLSVAEPTLETVFINLTGKELRE